MGDYEHSATVHASADRLFNYLADPANLPDFFSAMRVAEPVGGERVHVEAEVEGTERSGEARLHADHENRQIRWDAPGPHAYHGELDVTGDEHSSTVTVTLHTERADGPGIRAGLEETLANIKRMVEGSSTEPAG